MPEYLCNIIHVQMLPLVMLARHHYQSCMCIGYFLDDILFGPPHVLCDISVLPYVFVGNLLPCLTATILGGSSFNSHTRSDGTYKSYTLVLKHTSWFLHYQYPATKSRQLCDLHTILPDCQSTHSESVALLQLPSLL